MGEKNFYWEQPSNPFEYNERNLINLLRMVGMKSGMWISQLFDGSLNLVSFAFFSLFYVLVLS